MSIFGAMRSGVTGLFSQSQALGTIADNIANVNTVGFKAVRPRSLTVTAVEGPALSGGGNPGRTRDRPARSTDFRCVFNRYSDFRLWFYTTTKRMDRVTHSSQGPVSSVPIKTATLLTLVALPDGLAD